MSPYIYDPFSIKKLHAVPNTSASVFYRGVEPVDLSIVTALLVRSTASG